MIEDLLEKNFPRLSPLDPTLTAVRTLKTYPFVVIQEDECFIGVFTKEDLVEKQKVLIGDTLKRKPVIDIDLTINQAIKSILNSGFTALPCIKDEIFIGVLTLKNIYDYIERMNGLKSLDMGILGQFDNKDDKLHVLQKMTHFTGNNIQVLLSGLEILRETKLTEEQSEILDSMYNITSQFENTMMEFFRTYFPNEIMIESQSF